MFESNLWGIETWEWNKKVYCSHRLNRTCEGLKQKYSNFFTPYKFCLNRTCEGLKLSFIISSFLNGFCLNRTCEGLKRINRPWMCGSKLCLNRTCEGLKLICFWKGQFTSISLNRTCEGLKHLCDDQFILYPRKFESNLWGIETLRLLLNVSKIYFVLIEPVSDWNNLKNWKMNMSNSFESNLWGIETLLSRDAPHNLQSLNRTCEGLKQFICLLLSFPIYVWIEPVRDWNWVN